MCCEFEQDLLIVSEMGLWEDNIKMDLQEMGGACGDWSWLRTGTGGGHL
jgi:hypothetical protein